MLGVNECYYLLCCLLFVLIVFSEVDGFFLAMISSPLDLKFNVDKQFESLVCPDGFFWFWWSGSSIA